MTSRQTKLSLRAALLATAAVGALAMAPTAAYADAYAFVGVDVDNLLFTGINAFAGGNSFETTGSSSGTAGIGVENTDSGSTSTVKDNLDLTGGRGMTNNVYSASQLGTNPGANASSIPQVGDTGSYGVTDSIIIGSKSNTNASPPAVAGASWRASAEAALNQTGGSQTATSTQTLTWNLTVGPNTTVNMSFDISLSMISELSPAG
ncbi:MAG TPA: hypothetical protein VMU42_15840, partial [Candidatus Sulfotelmatobacter sp.]|nr:hypothetical protein [Candidatus Sulfotelmatobacter sp.]